MIRDSKAIQSEIEDFFANAEEQQQRFFIQKYKSHFLVCLILLSFRVWSDFGGVMVLLCRYNFDIVSDNPLPGRYEWVKVMP